MSTTTIVVICVVIALILIGAIVGIYNRLIRMIEAINNNKRQIDIQLDRRFKVFESLINVVKKYMDYEQTTLKDVVKLRGQAQDAAKSGDTQARMQAEEGISKIASNINLVFEQYPDLKANQNCLQLQEEVVNTENKLSYAKQAYNDSIERYYAEKKSFFQSMVVSWFRNALDKTFEYWRISDEQIKAHEDYTVKL
ncbi:MAG: LemA family protein [Legionellales bacterium]|nr:LemA family protein [Legionellales bacterium]|tara:strand:- start:45433 stop:46020 length:588 start_codon:yes stop_codon:yes gene_type:complete